MYSVYVLRSRQYKYLYVGLTRDLKRRVKEHQAKKERTTRSYAPFDLVHTEHFATRVLARQGEKELKSGAGKEWLKQRYPYTVQSLPEWRNGIR